MAAIPPLEEGKMLAEALSTVKIQVQQMKRYLVCRHSGLGKQSVQTLTMAIRRNLTNSWTASRAQA